MILIISQVNCDEQIKEKIVEYKKLLCENPLTDKQVDDIKNNCMANRHPKVSFVKFFSWLVIANWLVIVNWFVIANWF